MRETTRTSFHSAALRRTAVLAVLIIGLSTGSAAQASEVVAVLETDAPHAQHFILRATLPIPPGEFPRSDGRNPYAIVDSTGDLVETQIEVVSRYSDNANGADIIELLARVRRPNGVSVGSRIQYNVVRSLASPAPMLTLPSQVAELVDKSVHVVARDIFNNLYAVNVLNDPQSWRVLRTGGSAVTIRSFGMLEPVSPKGGPHGTLPFLMGVHAYVTALAQENVLKVDLRFNNGHFGDTPMDPDHIDRSYFKYIQVVVPSEFKVIQAFDDTFFGDSVTVGDWRVHTLVEPNAGGKLHVLPEQGQFHRRLAIVPGNQVAHGRHIVEEEGLAFCIPGFNADDEELFSWSNSATARFFPQKLPLPRIEHYSPSGLRSFYSSELNKWKNYMASGQPSSNDDYIHGALGWANPKWIKYGGGTGGYEIDFVTGIKLARAASRKGYRMHQIIHRMDADRHPTALYKTNGEPAILDDFAYYSGDSWHVPFEFGHTLTGNYWNNQFWQLNADPNFQVQTVYAQGLTPNYQNVLFEYDPHDSQHLIRFTRDAKVLAYFGNDFLSKDHLRAEAELFLMRYHKFGNPNGIVIGKSLLGHLLQAQELPNGGTPYKRGEAWSTDAVSAAYAMGDDSFRTRVEPWFEDLIELWDIGQHCSGSIQSIWNPGKIFEHYYGRQAYQEAIVQNAIRGVWASVFEHDAQKSALLESILAGSLDSVLQDYGWSEALHGPWTRIATANAANTVAYCTQNEVPIAGHSGEVERGESWYTIGLSMALLNDPLAYERAHEMGTQYWGSLDNALHDESSGGINLSDKGYVIAVLEDAGAF